jgi:hypothetical protein
MGSGIAFAIILILVAYWWLTMVSLGTPDDWAFDFRQFWQGANDVVNGTSPYPSSALLATAGDHLQPDGIREVFRFPYPAGAVVALAPLGLLSFHTAAAVWSAVLIVSVLAAVWTLGVRDWRVVAVVVCSAPVISSVRLGTLTPFLVLLLAVAWRVRDRRWGVASALAAAIALKIFLWPLVVWLAATRRWLEAAATCALALAFTAVAWAAIGFRGLAIYPDLVSRLTDIVADRGLSLVALGVRAGLARDVADVLPWLVGLGLLCGVVLLGRRQSGDRGAFTLALVAAIAITPIVWLHYFALLIVPLALRWPRFAWPWLLLLVFWASPVQENDGDLWRILLVDGVMVAVAVAAIMGVRRAEAATA